MECFYLENLDDKTEIIELPESEYKHFKALRIKPYELVLATNGRGFSAKISIENRNGKLFATNIQDKKYYAGELKFRLGLALGALDNKDRLEFAMEKSIELGVTDFYILKTQFSQKKNYSLERLNTKAIATMKQCKRSMRTNIDYLHKFTDIHSVAEQYDRIVLADEYGETIQNFYNTSAEKSTLILVGAEGGFSQAEIDILLEKHSSKIQKLKLGERRLRAETAAILSVGLFSL